MKWLGKAVAVVLAGLALLAPLDAAAHCDDDHEARCATECDCVCHAVPSPLGPAQTSLPEERGPGRAFAAVTLGAGRLSLADIYRPPTAA